MPNPYPPGDFYGPYGNRPTEPYPQPDYGQQQAYRQPGYPNQPGYGAAEQYAGGWGPQPPKKNRQNQLIGAAVVALIGIAATIVIVALNRDDDSTAADPSQSTSTKSETSPGESMTGEWEVTTTITKLSGVSSLIDSAGTAVVEGDVRWNTHAWKMDADDCKDEDNCTVNVSDSDNDSEFAMTLDGESWTATFDVLFECSDKSIETVTVDLDITRDDGSETLSGTMKTADNGSCGPNDNMKVEEEINLVKA